ncbi:MAG: hypothetical protein GX640_10710 [Fibrobacter sp.]|nr:hypothetical protein [Fibrobacter sp.]
MYSTASSRVMVQKVFCIFALLRIVVFSNTIDVDDSVNIKFSNKTDNRFNISAGFGYSMGGAGLSASYDFGKNWGAELSLGMLNILADATLRYNFLIKNYPLVISPRISMFNIYSLDILSKNHDVNFEFKPGFGVGCDFRTYCNRYIYINSTIGIGYLSGYVIPHTGLSLGYTFNKENPSHKWEKDFLISNSGLSILNGFVGIFFSVIVPIMVFSLFPLI